MRTLVAAFAIVLALVVGVALATMPAAPAPSGDQSVAMPAAAPVRSVSKADIVDPFDQPTDIVNPFDKFDAPADVVYIDAADLERQNQEQRERNDRLMEAREFGRAAGEAMRGQ